MPLHIPEQYRTYRLMGIDPGLNHTGVAIFDIEYGTSRILRIEAFTLSNDKLDDRTGLDTEYIPERTIKLYKLKGAIKWALDMTGPCFVACEAPFYNRFMPMAYGALLEVVSTIHSAVLEWNSNVQFVTIPPLSVKKVVGTKAVKNDTVKGKNLVKLSVQQIPEIMDVLTTPIDGLTEHAIDAIAVAYSRMKLEG